MKRKEIYKTRRTSIEAIENANPKSTVRINFTFFNKLRGAICNLFIMLQLQENFQLTIKLLCVPKD